MNAYRCQYTPGSEKYNPPGTGDYRPRAFCPHCGALVAQWHVTASRDFNEWLWYGPNDRGNRESPLPPSPSADDWGRPIPNPFVPSIHHNEIELDQIKTFTGKEVYPADDGMRAAEDRDKSVPQTTLAEEDAPPLTESVSAEDPSLVEEEGVSTIGDATLVKEGTSSETLDSDSMRFQEARRPIKPPRVDSGVSEKKLTRKLTALLSADVKGYSTLMEEDEISTVQMLVDYRNIMAGLIRQFRGRVVDSVGDNLLAEFASVVDAVQCAVEIQQVLTAKNELLSPNRRMEFRIGVNLGDVIEEEDRIYGEGVNIAARVESFANPGGICISGSAFEQIENKLSLDYVYIGEHKVKNIRKPVKIYRAQLGHGPSADVARIEKQDKKIRPGLLALSGVLFLVAGGMTWHFFLRPPASQIRSSGVKESVSVSPPKTAPAEKKQTLTKPSEISAPNIRPDKKRLTAVAKSPVSTGIADPDWQLILQELAQKLPNLSSETYLFSTREKALRNARMIALTLVGPNLGELKKKFEEKGFRVAIIPQSEIDRALETLIVDGVVTASKELTEKLKRDFQGGIAVRLHPELSIMDEKAEGNVLDGLIFADRIEVDFAPDWDPDIWWAGKVVEQHTKEQHLASLATWGDRSFRKHVDRDTNQTSDIRVIFKDVPYVDDFYVVICPPKGGGFYHGQWFVGDKLFLDRQSYQSHKFRTPECFRVPASAINHQRQAIVHARGFRGLYVNIAEIFLSDRVLDAADMDTLMQ